MISSSGMRVSGRLMAFRRHADMRGTRNADSVADDRMPDVYSTYRDAGMHKYTKGFGSGVVHTVHTSSRRKYCSYVITVAVFLANLSPAISFCSLGSFGAS